MKGYSIVSEKCLQNLTQKVNQIIISGHKCLGSPFQDSNQNFNQAMIADEYKIETTLANEYVAYEYFVHIKFHI